MPRKRKTMTGQDAAPVAPIAGQMYGAGVEQAQLQEQLPAPDVRAAPRPSPPPVDAMRQASASPAQPPADPMAALQAAMSLRGNAGLFDTPTARPEEPVTAGLRSGPGPGPEILQARPQSPTGRMLRDLAAATGDPRWASLAERARL